MRATGKRTLGTWFGDRVEARVESRLADGASCTETIDNGYSMVTDLVW